MKESVIEFIVYNKFVTGPSSTQQTLFMKTRNSLRAAFISPESPNRTIAVSVEFGAHISATFISANTTRRRQSQRLLKLANYSRNKSRPIYEQLIRRLYI